jgi:carotenoid 1,2-hydratase
MRWSGNGYLDSNSGDEPLENSFVRWDWSRASVRNGTAVLYDVTRRSGGDFSLALHFDRSGRAELFVPPTRIALQRSGWQIERNTRADAGYPARVVKTLEDTPFYARSLISTRLLGEHANAVHESLSLDRFRSRWVQMMLPFRMPRVRR